MTLNESNSILERESTEPFWCDGRNVSKRCLGYAKVRICAGCGLCLCANCFADHKEDVEND